ncbi:ribosome recycling factor [Akkermansiaceae bacterium]|nr:ribosome recycling factor [Akkermansiaceae bacterium]
MDSETVILEVEEAMQSAIEWLNIEFSSIRTGKASPALVEGIDVEVKAYGSRMKLKGLAVITTPEPRMLVVNPFDPSTIEDIDRAIREANLGFNPVNEGKQLRLPVPELTEERRKEMVKRTKGLCEDAKVRVRSARKVGMDNGKKMKADNILTEDAQKSFEEEVQEITNKSTKQIDEITASKEAEIMTV